MQQECLKFKQLALMELNNNGTDLFFPVPTPWRKKCFD